MGIVYILLLNNGKYYIGSTKDIQQRMKDHTRGHTISTKNRDPKLLFKKEFEDYKTARRREIYIKKSKKRSIVEKIIKGEFVW